MELAERIAGRVAELTGEVEQLRKQLADAEHELERLVIAGQVITQLMTGEQAAAAGGPAEKVILGKNLGGEVDDDCRLMPVGGLGAERTAITLEFRNIPDVVNEGALEGLLPNG